MKIVNIRFYKNKINSQISIFQHKPLIYNNIQYHIV